MRLGTQNRRRAYYDRFPESEMDRRRDAVRETMANRGLDALVVAADAGFAGTHLSYLTNYRPPFLTYFVFFADPAEASLLLVGLSNHLQYAREVSDADDVDVMQPDPMGRIAEGLRRGGAASGTVGLVGHYPRYDQTLSNGHHTALREAISGDLVDATADVTRVLSVRSDLERERVRQAAALTDRGVEIIAETAEPGVTERNLIEAVERSYRDAEGTLGMAFLTSAPMDDAEPGEPLPWHKPSNRPLRSGDVITTEMSAEVGGYRSQVHRTFAVGAEPTEAYERLWTVANETYEAMLDAVRPGNTAADVHEALGPIEASPYRIYDVCLHGYGLGYLPPYVGTADTNYWPGIDDPVTEDWTFREGEVVVLQPNVVTAEERHGLQLGSAVVVTDGAPEVLQEYPLTIQSV